MSHLRMQLLETWGTSTFDFHDAVYFTIITLSTVGYGDYYPISIDGALLHTQFLSF